MSIEHSGTIKKLLRPNPRKPTKSPMINFTQTLKTKTDVLDSLLKAPGLLLDLVGVIEYCTEKVISEKRLAGPNHSVLGVMARKRLYNNPKSLIFEKNEEVNNSKVRTSRRRPRAARRNRNRSRTAKTTPHFSMRTKANQLAVISPVQSESGTHITID